jgi:NAD-dependent dihydropyrimidine dehydrogenase PreA subunit
MNVDETSCAGCGVCVEVCESGAIRLVEACARIDPALCTECRSCVDVCPTGAIGVALPSLIPASLPTSAPARLPMRPEPQGTQMRVIAPAVGAALTFLGCEVAPRVAAAITEVILNRAEHPTQTAHPTPYTPAGHPRRFRRRAAWTNRMARG